MAVSVLFVCSRNLRRSAAAHGVFRYITRETGVVARVDSAGVSAVVGEPPHPMLLRAARMRGYDLSEIRSKTLVRTVVECFDYIVAFDSSQLRPLRVLCAGKVAVVGLLMSYSAYFDEREVAAPPENAVVGDYLRMLDRIEDACLGLHHHLVRRAQAPPDGV